MINTYLERKGNINWHTPFRLASDSQSQPAIKEVSTDDVQFLRSPRYTLLLQQLEPH